MGNRTEGINTKAINELIAIRRDNYLRDPRQIVSDYNNEIKNIDDYNGRQLLEMIQNANDESDTHKPKKVFIKLDSTVLLIGNNGNPFSKGGVESLMYSDMSPKTMEENKVGKKGLGFRSILNWSEEIYIASYDLHVKFSEKHAHLFLDDIVKEKPSISTIIEEKTKKKYPIAILRCPYIVKDSSLKKLTEYDTVIELDLRPGTHTKIEEQIKKDILPEILIFLNKLEEIEVETSKQHFSFKKRIDTNSNQIIIEKQDFKNAQNNQSWKWNILEETGDINGLKETKKYELKIAYNLENEISRNKLFSYFRTDIDFPYPVLAHGSFELKADRNQLAQDENDFNHKLLKKLAKLLVKCAIERTNKSEGCTYDALKIVVPKIGDSSLINQNPWNFDKYLDEQIAIAPLFPTIENTYSTLSKDKKFYDTNIASLIPSESTCKFNELLKYSKDVTIQSYFRNRNWSMKYDDMELTRRINSIIDINALTINGRVDWIYTICTQFHNLYKSPNASLPNLLIGTDKATIQYGSEAITPPEGDGYQMPSRINFAFINSEQFGILKNKFENKNTREILEKVKRFSITEYSLNIAIQKIVTGTDDILEEKPELQDELFTEMHRALFGIYKNIKEGTEAKNQYPINARSPKIYTNNGTLKSANQLYFGSEYTQGTLMYALLKNQKADVFVAAPDKINKDLDNSDFNKFSNYLEWLGVYKMPRKIELKLTIHNHTNNDFISKSLNELNYPYTIQNTNEVVNAVSSFNPFFDFTCTILWYEYFDDILLNASFESIITWFLKDQVLFNSIITNTEPSSSSFKFNIPNKQNSRTLRHSDLKSFIKDKISSIAFVPVGNGKKVKISEVLLDSSNLLPLIAKPEIIYDNSLFLNNQIDRERIDFILKRIGIKESLADVNLNDIYGYLLRHDTVFKEDTTNIQSFYTSIIEATKNKVLKGKKIPNRNKYFEIGKIFTRKAEDNNFVNVQKATYVDNPNFSRDLLNKLDKARLPMRSGNKRMVSLFNIQPLDYIKFNVDNVKIENEFINEHFINELNLLKPVLFMYRHNKGLKQSQSDDELRGLKKLQIITCKEVDVTYEINDIRESLTLYDYEFIQDEKSAKFYIKIPAYTSNYQELKNSFRFKETVADIICGTLKVSENRKDFMLLLGEDKNGWDQVLSREFDNYSVLEKEITKKFDGALTREQKFWDVTFKAANRGLEKETLLERKLIFKELNLDIELTRFLEICRKFDFRSLSKFENFPLISLVFNALKIDIVSFNSNGYKTINIIPYWENRLNTYNLIFQKKLKSLYYNEKNKENYKNLKEASVKKISCVNSIHFDYKSGHFSSYTEIFNKENYLKVLGTTVVDINTIYNEKMLAVKKQISLLKNFNLNKFNDLRYNDDFMISVLFDDTDVVKDNYKDKCISEQVDEIKFKIGNVIVKTNDDEALFEAIEKEMNSVNQELVFHDMKSIQSSKNKYSGGSRVQSTFSKNKVLSNSDIGFIGEKYAFEFLKKKFDKVEWVSEYALRAGYPNGTDGLGYDFECISGEETRYIEVKATTSSVFSFVITPRELNVGHKKSKSFDILFISNLLSNEKEFKYLKSIFNYDETESFLGNSKFLVENDNYIIRFK